MLEHRNAWFARHARRILHERRIRGENMSDAQEYLTSILRSEASEVHRLRALWAVHHLTPEVCKDLLEQGEASEHIRRWALRLMTDRADCDTSYSAGATRKWVPDHDLATLFSLAENEPSAKVRLELASVLQRLAPKHRIELASRLLVHAQDASDPYIPLMIWYGLEPAIADRVGELLRVATESQIPVVREFIARRIADMKDAPLDEIVKAALNANEQVAYDLLRGMLASLSPRGSHAPPASWDQLDMRLKEAESDDLRSVGSQLSLLFGKKEVIAELRAAVMNDSVDADKRRDAFRSLMKIDKGLSTAQLHALIRLAPELREDVLIALLQQE